MWLCPALRSGQNALHDVTMNVGEAEAAALVAVGQFGVIDSAEVEDGGLHIVDVDGILGDVPAKFIGFPIGRAGLDPSPRHDPTVSPAEVVASGRLLWVAGAVLTERGTSEFSPPNDEGVFKQTAYLQVLNEGGVRGVGVDALLFELGEKVAVLVPS